MSCQEFLARYSEYLDEVLDPVEAARCAHHVLHCASCSQYDRITRRGLDVLRSIDPIEPSATFYPSLQRRLSAMQVEPEAVARRHAGVSAVVSLAVVGIMAVIAWSPLLRGGEAGWGIAGTQPDAEAARAWTQSRLGRAAGRWDEPLFDGTGVSSSVTGLYATGWWGGGALLPRGPAFTPPSIRLLPAAQTALPGPSSPVVVAPPTFRLSDSASQRGRRGTIPTIE